MEHFQRDDLILVDDFGDVLHGGFRVANYFQHSMSNLREHGQAFDNFREKAQQLAADGAFVRRLAYVRHTFEGVGLRRGAVGLQGECVHTLPAADKDGAVVRSWFNAGCLRTEGDTRAYGKGSLLLGQHKNLAQGAGREGARRLPDHFLKGCQAAHGFGDAILAHRYEPRALDTNLADDVSCLLLEDGLFDVLIEDE